ncbi:MAG: tRNA uridine-5-carboxymethylaminomethyl(34) synthesis GTPase MnmE, partial [Bacteroidales bacterium]
MLSESLTICAPLHQPGSAITIIRVSGPQSIEICDRIFIARRRGRIVNEKGYTLVYGDIADINGDVIDEVMLSIFRSPQSYTGEDMVEIACHGSFYIQNKILKLLIGNGASTARAGEFTQRAFLNGKLDLSQAEAVADLIASESEAAHRLAMSQLKGGFSKEISSLRGELLNLVSLLELELDFGEDDVQFAERSKLIEIATRVRDYSGSLASSFSVGNALKRGIPVAIAGRTNVGKSTLLNGLLNEERAIVSDIPGTTRDAIEDTFSIDGVLYRFIDTAGLRETDDYVESLGIQRTRERISASSVVLLVTEAVLTSVEIDSEIEKFRDNSLSEKTSLIVIVNKSDLISDDSLESLRDEVRGTGNEKILFMSAQNDADYHQLRSALSEVTGISEMGNMVVITNARHYESLIQVVGAMERVLSGLAEDISTDLIAIDARQAIHYLGEITGEISTDEILGNIFRNFCIGK